MRGRLVAIGVAMTVVLVGVPTAAFAEDPVPTPSPTVPVVPTPTPTVPVIPTPTPTTPPVVVPSVPATPPPRTHLPLRQGDVGTLVAAAQKKLVWLGYPIGTTNTSKAWFGQSTQTAVKHFQLKFFLPQSGIIDARTWKKLVDVAGRVGSLPKTCTIETSLCADKKQKILRYVVNGKVRLTLDARFGLPGMDTGNGPFRVVRKSRDHVSSLYHTWMPFAMFFNGGEAVHYSPYFQRDGYNGGSHGCIGVRNIELAEWLFDRVPIGTRVFVYSS